MLSVRKLENFRNLGFYLELDVNKFHLALSIWALTLVFFLVIVSYNFKSNYINKIIIVILKIYQAMSLNFLIRILP